MYYTDKGFAIVEAGDPKEWGSWSLDYNMRHAINLIYARR